MIEDEERKGGVLFYALWVWSQYSPLKLGFLWEMQMQWMLEINSWQLEWDFLKKASNTSQSQYNRQGGVSGSEPHHKDADSAQTKGFRLRTVHSYSFAVELWVHYEAYDHFQLTTASSIGDKTGSHIINKFIFTSDLKQYIRVNYLSMRLIRLIWTLMATWKINIENVTDGKRTPRFVFFFQLSKASFF